EPAPSLFAADPEIDIHGSARVGGADGVGLGLVVLVAHGGGDVDPMVAEVLDRNGLQRIVVPILTGYVQAIGAAVDGHVAVDRGLSQSIAEIEDIAAAVVELPAVRAGRYLYELGERDALGPAAGPPALAVEETRPLHVP